MRGILTGLALAAAVPAARTYTNPILYADYSDPDVIRVGSDYYMAASSFHFSLGFPVLRPAAPAGSASKRFPRSISSRHATR